MWILTRRDDKQDLEEGMFKIEDMDEDGKDCMDEDR